MRLDAFSPAGFDRGASRATEAAWLVLSGLLVASWLPGSRWRRWLLRAFGAQIGRKVVIKAKVRVKFPWRLTIGDHSWIGEDAWIDNLDEVRIGSNCCISQGVLLCTGSHDWSLNSFDLVTKPIVVEDSAWITARAVVGPGVVVGEGAVLGLASTATKSLEPWIIYFGDPAISVRMRDINFKTQ